MVEIHKNVLDKKTHDEINGIKHDMEDIIRRASNLKGEAMKELFHQSNNLLSTLNELKGKASWHCDESLKTMAECIQKKPIKSMWCAFGAGALLMMLFRK
jgi:ElaB/YqjD/DUF883 family membrane-anchored ribosome-binding protein